MSPRSEREFVVSREDDETTIVFERDAAGKVGSLTYGGRRASRVGSLDAPSPAKLADYTGEYYSEELGTSYRVNRQQRQVRTAAPPARNNSVYLALAAQARFRTHESSLSLPSLYSTFHFFVGDCASLVRVFEAALHH